MSATSLELIAGSIIILSIFAKIITDLHTEKRIPGIRSLPPFPRIVLLIFVGLILGPGLGYFGYRVIDLSTFGGALPTIVSLAVAIILFEGGFHLDLAEVYNEGDSLKLVLIGAPITILLSGVSLWQLLGIQIELAFLIAALLAATGPTVIEPILAQVDAPAHVKRVLTTEGIVNDALAAVLAVVIFEFAVMEHGEGSVTSSLASSFIIRIAVGIFIGLAIGWLAYIWLIKADLTAENTRLAVIAIAILGFISADSIIGEAGIVASAVSGMVIGNGDYIPPTQETLPHKEQIAEFGQDITTLVLGIIFIILAAMMNVQDIQGILVPGVAFIAILMVVIRPLSVFASLYRGSQSKFDKNDLIYMSAVGPRGIIPAAVATLFSLQLAEAGVPNAEVLAGMVFMVIVFTVIIEGILGVYLPELLFETETGAVIIGGGRMGTNLAEQIKADGGQYEIIENDRDRYQEIRGEYSVTNGDGTDVSEILDAMGGTDINKIVAATDNDDINLFSSLIAQNSLDATTYARVNRPENKSAWEDLGIKAVSPATAAADELESIIPSHAKILTVSNDDLDGIHLSEFEFNEAVNRIHRDDRTLSKKSDPKIQKGDEIVVYTESEEVIERIKDYIK